MYQEDKKGGLAIEQRSKSMQVNCYGLVTSDLAANAKVALKDLVKGTVRLQW
jgi:hypothetical protein